MLLLLFTAFMTYTVDAKIPRFRSSLATSDVQIRSTVRMDLLSQCDELWRDTNLDHFTFVGGIMAHGHMLAHAGLSSHLNPKSFKLINYVPPQGKHERGIPDTFKQRYFVCGNHWQPQNDGSPGPIFFYFGNEANVELYLNNTGLMWESAPDFGALIVFAEHR